MIAAKGVSPSDGWWVEVPKPNVKAFCKVCAKTVYAIGLPGPPMRSGVVSPAGVEHIGLEGGDTACGKDATPNGWWWPL